ncbi:MAG: hypothetical protein ACREL9_04375 [Gemmatimonadales bacterium]
MGGTRIHGVRRAVGLLLGTGLAVVGAARADAQLREVRTRGFGGGGILIAEPVGEFANFVGTHGGFGGAVTFGRNLGLRIGGSLLIYGHQSRPIPLAGTGGLIALDLSTNNYIASLGLGPQVTLGEGPLQLYGYGTVGLGYFGTTSSVSGSYDYEPFASTTNFDNATLALETGGGLQIRLANPRRPVFLDLSARYVRNGRVRYVTESGVRENPDGSFTLYPIESQANLVVFQIGVSVGLR